MHIAGAYKTAAAILFQCFYYNAVHLIRMSSSCTKIGNRYSQCVVLIYFLFGDGSYFIIVFALQVLEPVIQFRYDGQDWYFPQYGSVPITIDEYVQLIVFL